MSRSISPDRKLAHLMGTCLMVVGGLMFAFTALSMVSDFGSGPTSIDSASSSMISFVLGGFGGVALMGVGRGMRTVAARGLAGSGVVLDPERARKDLEPWSRMAGGMVQDALSETDLEIGRRGEAGGEPERVVMLKCTGCGKLNEEDSRFCQECGAAL